jgi:hypothetical protein
MDTQHLARRLAAALTVLSLAGGCGTAGAAPGAIESPSNAPPPASTAASLPPLTPAPDPTPVATPAGTPRPPGAADLVVRLTWDSDVVVPIPGTTIVDDGRVIWMGKGDEAVIVERRLTDAGLAWVRARLDDTGALRATGHYGATLRPGAQPDPRGGTMYLFRLQPGGTRIKVITGDPGDYGHEPDLWDIPAQMQPLADLAHGLQDPVAWIDPAMWVGPAEPYRAHAYLVTVRLDAGPPAFGHYPFAVDEVAWPFPVPITEAGLPFRVGGQVVEGERCLVLTREQAQAMADAEAATARPRELAAWDADIGYREEAGKSGHVIVTTRPLFPYQSQECSDALAW